MKLEAIEGIFYLTRQSISRAIIGMRMPNIRRIFMVPLYKPCVLPRRACVQIIMGERDVLSIKKK